MRLSMMGLLAAFLLVGCGPPLVEDLGGSTSSPSPTDSPSSFAAPLQSEFEANVQPFFDNSTGAQACNDADCHDEVAPQLGLTIYVSPDATQLQANYDRLSCYPFVSSFDPPDSTLLGNFCNGDVSNNIEHNLNTATDADCAAIYNWIATGVGSANEGAPCP